MEMEAVNTLQNRRTTVSTQYDQVTNFDDKI